MYLNAKPWIARLASTAFLLASCWRIAPIQAGQRADASELLNSVAESYVHLVLQVGNYDGAYVDYYYGPEKLRLDAQSSNSSLQEIRSRADALTSKLSTLDGKSWDRHDRIRLQSLRRQLISLAARTRQLEGEEFDFNQESELVYGTSIPAIQDTHTAQIHVHLDSLLPGPEPLQARFDALRNNFIVPPKRVENVFRAAVDEARSRTLRRIELQPEESFDIEITSGVSWGAYIHYQGSFRSVIQVNTDMPFAIDELLSLACHEGYPGHHSNFVLWEKHLYINRGWIEYSVYPLFSPMTVALEGAAQCAVDLAFPPDERSTFLESVLCPLAGIDSNRIELYLDARRFARDLDYVGVDVARRYHDSMLDRIEAKKLLTDFRLDSSKNAEMALDFFEQYGVYAMTYAVGRRLVRDHIERESEGNHEVLWSNYEEFLKSPMLVPR